MRHPIPPDRASEIHDQLAHAGPRYVVTDLVACGMPRQLAEQIGPEGPLAPPPAYNRGRTGFPWALPVVYRAGTYLVHKVDRPSKAAPPGSGVQNSDLADAHVIRE